VSKGKQRALWAAAIGGAVVAGAATGFGAERKLVRSRRLVPDPGLEQFADLAPDRTYSVDVGDGVSLHVEEVGASNAPLAVIFLHGFTQRLDCWHFQRSGLADLAGPKARLLFIDQRGHGRSARGSDEQCTIEQLGVDMVRVLEDVVPTGDVVLVGHSMGGMTIMALAETAPEIFRARVVGAALIATSAGDMASVTFGLPTVMSKAVSLLPSRVWSTLGRQVQKAERLRGSDIAHAAAQRVGFGDGEGLPPSMVDYVTSMIDASSMETMAVFLPAFLEHDRHSALKQMHDLEMLIIVGDHDLMTPVEHSRAIARALPNAKLVVLPGAGHMVIMERSSLVNLHLRALIGRVRAKIAA
jgi:pimeloyl-ACP methyl ester carboxylesterase